MQPQKGVPKHPKTISTTLNTIKKHQKFWRIKELQLQDMSEGAFEVPRLEILHSCAALLHHGLLHVLCFFHQCLQPPGDDSNRRRFRGNLQDRSGKFPTSAPMRWTCQFWPGFTIYPFQAFTKSNSANEDSCFNRFQHVLTCFNMFQPYKCPVFSFSYQWWCTLRAGWPLSGGIVPRKDENSSPFTGRPTTLRKQRTWNSLGRDIFFFTLVLCLSKCP